MWNVEWNAISARIAALIEAGTYFVRATANGWHDSFGTNQRILQNAHDIRERIGVFQKNHGSQLTEAAKQCLDRFLGEAEPSMTHGEASMHAALIQLASFRAEFSYLITDTEAVGRSLVIRAFTHLNRSIVADSDFRRRWDVAFCEGELSCERLGACHLLLHGVWAFKASAAGGRTDLVLGTPLSEGEEVRIAANTLVLTEWKVVNDASQTIAKANEAYEQAKRYSSGVLAGFELSSRRYLVLVSGNDLISIPPARIEGSVIYEYVNVPVSPSTPSQIARITARTDAG